MRILPIVLLSLFVCSSSVLAQEQPPAKVVVDKVVQEEVAESQSAIGVLYFERVAAISTEVAGLVEEVPVKEGERVKKGDLLVRLNTEILDSEISLTKTRIEQIELRKNNAKKNFDRVEKLYKEDGVSEKSFDDALFDYQDAEKEQQATRESLEALLIRKKRSMIRAPFDGVIMTKDVDSGAWVQQGKQMVSLGSVSDLYVRTPVAENLLQFVDIGSEVPVKINAFQQEVMGKILAIDPVADIKTKNVFVKIGIPSLPVVAQNMSATVNISASARRMLSVLPRAALIKFQGKDFVYTVKDGKAAILPVNIVAYLGDRIGVDNPYIVPGMDVVVEGNERLRPDQPVQIAGGQ